MFACLLVLRTLDRDAIKHLELLEKEECIESVALFTGDGVAAEIEDDQLVEPREVFDLIGVSDLVITKVELHQTAQFWKLCQ